MQKFFLILVTLFFNGCVIKKEYYSSENPTVVKSTYNMENECYNCAKDEEVIEITGDIDTIYLSEDTIYIEEIVYEDTKTNIVYVNENDYNEYEDIVYYTREESEYKNQPTYSEEVIYYYEEEL